MDALKTASRRAIQKTSEATGDLIGNNIRKKIKKAGSKTTCEEPDKSPARIDETLVQAIGIPKKKCISHITKEVGKLFMKFDYCNYVIIYHVYTIYIYIYIYGIYMTTQINNEPSNFRTKN